MDDREKEKGASSLPFLLGVYQERKEEEGEAQSLFPLFPLLACGLSLDRATMFVAAPFPPSLRFPYIPLSVSTSIPRRPRPPPPPGKRFDDGTLCSSFPFPLPFLSAEIRKGLVHSLLAFLFSIHEKQIASLGTFFTDVVLLGGLE